jgi:HK97 family phage portal protein
MGFFTNFLNVDDDNIKVDASVAPYVFPDQQQTFYSVGFNPAISRSEAMAVPAVARARNIICGTIASLPRQVHREMDEAYIEAPSIIKNPDPRMASAVIYAYTIEDLLFRGQAYWQVTEVDPLNKPVSAQWISADRVFQKLDYTSKFVIGYEIDAILVPNAGVGSLIPFVGLDEGILNRAGLTLRSALELEKASYRFAQEPTPTMILKSTLPLPKERVTALLDAWKTARNTRGTAFLNDSVDMTSVGFNSAELQLIEARQHLVAEVARLTGIPEWYLGVNSSGMTYSNVTSERRALIDFSLKPILVVLEETLSMLLPRGQHCRFDLDDFLRGNPTERAEIYSKLVPLGIMTVDEVRRDEDLVDPL